MAVSKQRKKTKTGYRKPKPPKPDFTYHGNNLHVSRKKYQELKDNPDFVTLVRLGRVANALSFSANILNNVDVSDKSPTSKRNYVRSLLVTAGYLHESLAVFSSLQLKYNSFDFFSRINAVLNPSVAARKKLLKLIRDGGAFHLDSDDKITSKTLPKMDAEGFQIFSGTSHAAFDFYFDFSDVVDLNYYIWNMSSEKTADENQEEIFNAIIELTKDSLEAAHECIAGLLVKLPFGFAGWKMVEK